MVLLRTFLHSLFTKLLKPKEALTVNNLYHSEARLIPKLSEYLEALKVENPKMNNNKKIHRSQRSEIISFSSNVTPPQAQALQPN